MTGNLKFLYKYEINNLTVKCFMQKAFVRCYLQNVRRQQMEASSYREERAGVYSLCIVNSLLNFRTLLWLK